MIESKRQITKTRMRPVNRTFTISILHILESSPIKLPKVVFSTHLNKQQSLRDC